MSVHAIAALVVVLAWWASTGAVLRVVWRPRSTHRAAFAVATVLAVAALAGLWVSRHEVSSRGAYGAFVSALIVWGWHELSFLFGFITGPRKTSCPPEARGWRRFTVATEAVIHHEVALALTFVAILGLTWGAPNQVGTGTFAVLWVMRLSAKLNVFLGVRNLSEEFVPAHLRYLATYFRRARLNPLMPIAIVASSMVLAFLVHSAVSPDPASATAEFTSVGHSILATLLGLAILEHVFLSLPVPDAVLWRWVLPGQRASPHEAGDDDRVPAAPPTLGPEIVRDV